MQTLQKFNNIFVHYTKIIVIFAVIKTDAMEDKKMKRYKIWMWVWLILTAAAYINAVWDIIINVKKIWE